MGSEKTLVLPELILRGLSTTARFTEGAQ
jgi:hypothetical protein